MSSWVFLSHVLSLETPGYGNKLKLELKPAFLGIPNHLGTHIDCPKHFFEGGATVDKYPADFWRFENVCVVDCPKQPGEVVQVSDFETHLKPNTDALLLRTGFERRRGEPEYWQNNPGLSPEIGTFLRKNFSNVRLIGVDLISISGYQNRELGREAHRTLLDPEGVGNPLVIIEDMALAGIQHLSEMTVLPVRVQGADGSPCTVLGRA